MVKKGEILRRLKEDAILKLREIFNEVEQIEKRIAFKDVANPSHKC
jgi:hypothetical protein